MDEIELAIIRLQMKNKLLKNFLDTRQHVLNQAEINGILDEIGRNLRIIKLLEEKRGH